MWLPKSRPLIRHLKNRLYWCGKFRTRWAFMEGAAAGQGRRVEDLSMEDMDERWQLSKALEGDGLG